MSLTPDNIAQLAWHKGNGLLPVDCVRNRRSSRSRPICMAGCNDTM